MTPESLGTAVKSNREYHCHLLKVAGMTRNRELRLMIQEELTKVDAKYQEYLGVYFDLKEEFQDEFEFTERFFN